VAVCGLSSMISHVHACIVDQLRDRSFPSV
jgi:hypothetical protein